MTADLLALGDLGRRGDRQDATVGHRVSCVDGEVHHGVLDLTGIGPDSTDRAVELNVDPDPADRDAPDQRLDGGDQLADIDRARFAG